MVDRDEARELLDQNPDEPLVGVPGAGLYDRATLEFLASDLPLPRQGDLDELVGAANRVEVVPAGPSAAATRPTVVRLGLFARRALKKKLRIDEPDEGFHCMCLGTEVARFYRGNKLLAEIGFHHGATIRWEKRWSSDAALRDPRPVLELLRLERNLAELAEAENVEHDIELVRQALSRTAPPWLQEVVGDPEAFIEVVREHAQRPQAIRELFLWAGGERPQPSDAGIALSHLLPELALSQVQLDTVVAQVVEGDVDPMGVTRFFRLRPLLRMMGVPVDETPVDERFAAPLYALADRTGSDGMRDGLDQIFGRDHAR